MLSCNTIFIIHIIINIIKLYCFNLPPIGSWASTAPTTTSPGGWSPPPDVPGLGMTSRGKTGPVEIGGGCWLGGCGGIPRKTAGNMIKMMMAENLG